MARWREAKRRNAKVLKRSWEGAGIKLEREKPPEDF
jgi:hypothetical protein